MTGKRGLYGFRYDTTHPRINHYKMRFRFMSVKWNAATRYSAHPFTTKTGARVHFFCLNYPRIRGWYQARVHPFSSGNGKGDGKATFCKATFCKATLHRDLWQEPYQEVSYINFAKKPRTENLYKDLARKIPTEIYASLSKRSLIEILLTDLTESFSKFCAKILPGDQGRNFCSVFV